MRWEDERYIRIFTRDTPTWDAMEWKAQRDALADEGRLWKRAEDSR